LTLKGMTTLPFHSPASHTARSAWPGEHNRALTARGWSGGSATVDDVNTHAQRYGPVRNGQMAGRVGASPCKGVLVPSLITARLARVATSHQPGRIAANCRQKPRRGHGRRVTGAGKGGDTNKMEPHGYVSLTPDWIVSAIRCVISVLVSWSW
jgi:hypothetical protein